MLDDVKFGSLALGGEPRRQFSEGTEPTARRSSVSSSVAYGMRRRSFFGMQVELKDVFAGSGVKVVSVDMPPFMQIHAVDCARKANDSLEKFSCKLLASTLKKVNEFSYRKIITLDNCSWLGSDHSVLVMPET